ncbi:MAG TPA: glycoside hydrolase family 2 TIM barrel-domain containing protein, partial [Isosphaeraceae bacterium]|nr:glycoside hydrolase family 2 TIM barrel-domain containing protein [Isosphaeraceae bacterium]
TTYVTHLDGTVTIRLATTGNVDGRTAKVTASLDGHAVATADGPPDSITLKIPNPELWSPDSPNLYDLRIELADDVVQSYVGIREVGRAQDDQGHWRFTLNGKRIFPFGTLDQGWWPDGLLTPPSDEAMVSDIKFLKEAGFNTIRKHIKVEPRRYYTHCDQIGMLVWQDQVSSMSDNPKWTRLAPDPETRTWPEAAHRQFMTEFEQMIDVLHDHPCIVQWIPFNERWGQHQSVEVGKWAVEHDPTRLVNIASGGNWFPVGHIVDHHQYPHPGFPFAQGKDGRFDDFIKVVGEFGGHGYPVEGHLWDPNTRNWGYGGLPRDKDEWLDRYKESIRRLAELKQQGIAAGIYTQTTDVEGEINGLLTYDRKVQKLSPAQLAEIHATLFDDQNKADR